MALADLNGDGIIDVVEAQGEVPGHEDERVYLCNMRHGRCRERVLRHALSSAGDLA